MKITPDAIIFSKLAELSGFITEFDLLGHIRLQEPVIDNSGNVLIKEFIPVKESMLEKLVELQGNYRPYFRVDAGDEIIKRIGASLTAKITESLKIPKNLFVNHIYSTVPLSYRAFIANSFQSKNMTLLLYKMASERTEFFYHIADLALLSLGIALVQPVKMRGVHRLSFLVGLCADLALADSEEWRNPLKDDFIRRQIAENSAQTVLRLGLPEPVAFAIRNQFVNVREPAGEGGSVFSGFLEDEGEGFAGGATVIAEDRPGDPADEADGQTRQFLIEVIKIARFVFEAIEHLRECEDFVKQLIERMAYNAARGYFSEELFEPILRKFKEYEETARIMMHVARTERKCIHQPSAWAYPKPKATQILCRNEVFTCPNILLGWDIHVVSYQEAFGWVGLSLDEGRYPKCVLEKELKDVPKKLKRYS